MLKDKQAAELLKRCESIIGSQLKQIRGNLRKPASRAAAVWELILLDAAADIGRIRYEPLDGASPDIELTLEDGGIVWLEAAFIHPRFLKEDKQSDDLARWIYNEAKRQGIETGKIGLQYFGDLSNKAGPRRYLPRDSDKRSLLLDPELVKFFDEIRQFPNKSHRYDSGRFSFLINYQPGDATLSSFQSGLVQDAPKEVQEHAVYRALKAKARQFDIKDPFVCAVCSDQSRVVSGYQGPMEVSVRQAIGYAMYRNTSLSAVLLVEIRDSQNFGAEIKKVANPSLILNENAKFKLTESQIEEIRKINLNKWKYGFPLSPWDNKRHAHINTVAGGLEVSPRGCSMKLKVPTTIIIDALAGKTSLAEAYGLKPDDPMLKGVYDRWDVVSCSYEEGSIERAEAPKIVFELSLPIPSAYWPEKSE